MRPVRLTLFDVESNKCFTFRVSVRSLSYLACNAHAPYCRLWPAPLYHIIPHYLINGISLGKRLTKVECVFLFSLQILCEIFLITRKIQRDIIINIQKFSRKISVILVRF